MLSSVKYIVASLLVLGISVVSAQEAPYYTTELYHPTESHRQNVCDRHDKYYNGEVNLRDALQGLELRPIIAVSNLFRLKDGKVDQEDPGIIGVVLDELGRRCGFTWRNSYAIYYGPGEGKSYTDLLVWSSEAFDMTVDWYFNTLERLRAGIGFPRGFYDGSYILVGKKDEVVTEQMDLFNWLAPFDNQLWWAILGTILVSAVVYMVLENLNRREEKRDWSLSRNVFYSFMLGAQHNQFNPKSPPARLFAVSLAFWSLIIVATYTANLASFFVVQNTPGLQVNSIDDVVLARLPICVVEGYASSDFVEQNYPRGVYVYKSSEAEQYQGVINGDCSYALSSIGSWKIYENDKTINGDCELTWVGRVVRFVEAGFGLKADAGVLCTSLIQDVLNVHLVEMVADGFIERAWQDFYRKNMEIDCAAMSHGSDVVDSPELSLDEMGGTFFIHCMGAVLAFLITAGNRFRFWYREQRQLKNKEVVEYVEAQDESSSAARVYDFKLSAGEGETSLQRNTSKSSFNQVLECVQEEEEEEHEVGGEGGAGGSAEGGAMEKTSNRSLFKQISLSFHGEGHEFSESRLEDAPQLTELQEQLRVLHMNQQEMRALMMKELNNNKQHMTAIVARLQDKFHQDS